MDRDPVIVLDRVTKTFGHPSGPQVVAVADAALAVAESEFVVITGRSGSGKTTLLNLIAGLATPTSGTVTLDGQDLWAGSDSERARIRNARIGFVFQFPSLMPTLTASENVMLPVAIAGRRGADDVGDRAAELLALVGLAQRAGAYPRELSAGEQQRVVLARSLVNRPRLILADEPTSNLDEQTEREMMDLFRDVHATTGVTIVMVTHAAALMGRGTRRLEMTAGALREPDAVQGDE